MWAYYNNADEVELYVNGVSQGVSSKTADRLHAFWRVTYQPGEVKAVSRKDGKVVAEQTIKTAGQPAVIRLTPDRSEINADGTDLSYVAAEVLDKDGNLCPWAEDEITFSVSGAGRNVGVDNGSPISLERFKADHRKAFYGKAMLIVQSDGTKGNISVKATSGTLKAGEAKITTH
jgi:beta-galactosidase